MPTVQVKVPLSGNKNEVDGWLENVSQHISAGKDVEFIDENTGLDVNIGRVQCDGAGNIAIWGAGYSSSSAQAIAFTAGEFHRIGGIHGIRVADTTATGIHVKI